MTKEISDLNDEHRTFLPNFGKMTKRMGRKQGK